jgi:hypothetical protein
LRNDETDRFLIYSRLLVRGEVTAGQTLDPKAEHSQPLSREVDLPMFKGIFVAADVHYLR